MLLAWYIRSALHSKTPGHGIRSQGFLWEVYSSIKGFIAIMKTTSCRHVCMVPTNRGLARNEGFGCAKTKTNRVCRTQSSLITCTGRASLNWSCFLVNWPCKTRLHGWLVKPMPTIH